MDGYPFVHAIESLAMFYHNKEDFLRRIVTMRRKSGHAVIEIDVTESSILLWIITIKLSYCVNLTPWMRYGFTTLHLRPVMGRSVPAESKTSSIKIQDHDHSFYRWSGNNYTILLERDSENDGVFSDYLPQYIRCGFINLLLKQTNNGLIWDTRVYPW